MERQTTSAQFFFNFKCPVFHFFYFIPSFFWKKRDANTTETKMRTVPFVFSNVLCLLSSAESQAECWRGVVIFKSFYVSWICGMLFVGCKTGQKTHTNEIPKHLSNLFTCQTLCGFPNALNLFLQDLKRKTNKQKNTGVPLFYRPRFSLSWNYQAISIGQPQFWKT